MKRTAFRAEPGSVTGLALTVGLLLAASLTACGGDSDTSGEPTPPASATRSATPASLRADDPAIEPGTYLISSDDAWSVVDYTITFPEGWRVRGGQQYEFNGGEVDEVDIVPFVVDEIFADACLGDEGAVTKVGPSAQDLVRALLAQRGPAKSDPVETTLGGYPATRIDLHVPRRLQTTYCFLGPGTGVQLWLSKPDKYLVLDAEGIVSVYVVDVEGERQVFTTQYRPAHTSEEDRAELQQVLDSIHIEP